MNTPFPTNILDHYEDPYHHGSCDRPTHRGEQLEGGCGDTILVELQVVDNVIKEAWFQGDGCILSQSAASFMVEYLEGKSLEELEKLSASQLERLMEFRLALEQIECCKLPVLAAQSAGENPIDEEEDGPTFLGLNLGDEC